MAPMAISLKLKMIEIFSPLSVKRREGCRAKRWQGESTNEAALSAAHGGNFTHPNVAALVHPLFRRRKRGLAALIFIVTGTLGFNAIAIDYKNHFSSID